MGECIFCKIIQGKLPSFKVYEDKYFLGFLDIRPLTKGNTLLVPKRHYRWVIDVPNFGLYWEAAKKVGRAAEKAFKTDWISFITLGLEVSHAHIRIVPRYKNDLHDVVVDVEKTEKFTQKEMADIADRLKEMM